MNYTPTGCGLWGTASIPTIQKRLRQYRMAVLSAKYHDGDIVTVRNPARSLVNGSTGPVVRTLGKRTFAVELYVHGFTSEFWFGEGELELYEKAPKLTIKELCENDYE